MDRSVYHTITTKRGLKYAYASIPADGTPKDTLLFVHGFPSSSYDWRKQVDFFRKAGFSLIIPDMLGAGETEKPADWTVFGLKAMAGDVIDILDAEKVEKVVVIGHDWCVSPRTSSRPIIVSHLDSRGSLLVSRLAVYYPDRFKAYAFAAAGFSPIPTGVSWETSMSMIKQVVGYEPMGYWEYVASLHMMSASLPD